MQLIGTALKTLQDIAYSHAVPREDANGGDVRESIRRLHSAGFVYLDAIYFDPPAFDITEAGRAALAALRKANPLASPVASYAYAGPRTERESKMQPGTFTGLEAARVYAFTTDEDKLIAQIDRDIACGKATLRPSARRPVVTQDYGTEVAHVPADTEGYWHVRHDFAITAYTGRRPS